MTRFLVNRPALVLVVLFSSLAAALIPARAGQAGPEASRTDAGQADPSHISVSLDTLTLLNGKKGDIEVLQLLRVFNSGVGPYLGEPSQAGAADGPEPPRAVFRVPVPEGAFDIAPSDLRNPQGMSEGPAGIVTTAPLPPGDTLVSFIYRVRPSRTGWALRRQIDYPTRSINLLLGPGLELEAAPGFKLIERKMLGEVEYRRFRAGPFSPGSVLTADVGFGGNSSERVWLGFAWAAAVVTAIALGLAVLLRRRRPAGKAANTSPGDGHEPAGHRDDLILQIARLDEEFDSGAIPEEAYHSRRRALKEKLGTLSESVKQ